jgi:hypothetical protein
MERMPKFEFVFLKHGPRCAAIMRFDGIPVDANVQTDRR